MQLWDLFEAVNHSTMEVYHFTTTKGMRSILEHDVIEMGASKHELGGRTLSGVSVTRNAFFNIQSTYAVGGAKPWRIGLDYRKLRQNLRVIPIRDEYLRSVPRQKQVKQRADAFGDYTYTTSSDEMEEFVLGKIELSRYITSIAVEDESADFSVHPNDILKDAAYYLEEFGLKKADAILAYDILASVDYDNFHKISSHPRHGTYEPREYMALPQIPFNLIDRGSGRSTPVVKAYSYYFEEQPKALEDEAT